MTRPASPSVAQVFLNGFIGTAVEGCDFVVYGAAAALVFGELFFPKLDPFAALMASFSTYAVGYFARLLGKMIFGHFGDRVGRKSALVVSLMMMGAATFSIGLLPTHQHIGPGSAMFLVLLRFVQGLGVGVEWGRAVLLAVDHGGGSGLGFRLSAE